MDASDEQQFCLRWNNFQANITSQFEALRDDEDFTDVTIACEGQRLQAHKVVLSACSPYFKELFKNNPCSHPIIFMRDVEARHIVALMEFMYAGEVNVAQAHLSAFLKTAESLKIRGLTDTQQEYFQKEDENFLANSQSTKECSKNLSNGKLRKNQSLVACNSTVTSSQDFTIEEQTISSPPPKRQCITETENEQLEKQIVSPDLPNLNNYNDELIPNSDKLNSSDDCETDAKLKLELPDYISDEEKEEKSCNYFTSSNDVSALTGVDVTTKNNFSSMKQSKLEMNIGLDSRKLHSLDPRPCEECGRVYSNLSNLRQHMKLIHYPTFVSCPVCMKSFKTDLYLRRHMITTHESTNFKHVILNGRSESQKIKQIGSYGTHSKLISNTTNQNIYYKHKI